MPHNSSVRQVEIVLGFIVDWKYPGMISIILPENIMLGWVLPHWSYAVDAPSCLSASRSIPRPSASPHPHLHSPRLSDFTFPFHFDALEKEMATHSSVLAWRIPGTGAHGGLPSMGLHKVGHGWSDLAAAAAAAGQPWVLDSAFSDFAVVSPRLVAWTVPALKTSRASQSGL